MSTELQPTRFELPAAYPLNETQDREARAYVHAVELAHVEEWNSWAEVMCARAMSGEWGPEAATEVREHENECYGGNQRAKLARIVLGKRVQLLAFRHKQGEGYFMPHWFARFGFSGKDPEQARIDALIGDVADDFVDVDERRYP